MSESKLFVGGLSWETTQESLQAYFEKFGEITEVTLKTDANTGRSRGFGFVSFADPSSVSQVMSTSSHFLDDRKIDPKVAKAKGGRDGYGEPTLKVFVGGLDPEVPEEEIRAHFSQFGTVEEVDLPFDKVNQQRRAFCFIKFASEDVVNEVVSKMKQHIGNNEVTVKKATPKNDRQDDFGGRGGGGRGGRGGRGGYGATQGYGGAQGGYGGGGYGNGGGYGGYEQSYGGGQAGYGTGYGAGDDGYGGYGGQTQSRSYHPYQR